jgi:hypothetical protein
MASSLLIGRRSLLQGCGLVALAGAGPAQAMPTAGPGARIRQAVPGHLVAPAPPTAYVVTAKRAGVPPWLLYGVALQESKLRLGEATVPYPWTLGVRGRGERYASFHAATAALQRHLQAGVRNIDCGAMQINWHWHRDQLVHPARALHPYANLAIGAAILRRHFMATGSWDEAVGLYHTGSVRSAEQRGRSARYRASVARGLHTHGVSMQAVIQGQVLASQRSRDA